MRLFTSITLSGFLSLSIALAPLGAQVKYVLLSPRAVNGIVEHRGGWSPTDADVAELEASIGQISTLQIEGWTSELHIEHPENYYRQYVPILRAGRRLVYVSAFCEEPPPSDWRKRLVVVIDGATCFWQAFYDPVSKKYSHLRINARA